MKKPRVIFFAVLLALTLGLTSLPAHAADTTTPISDTQAEEVRENCKQAQSTLQRLQSTDVATRVNRGRLYESLINQLIDPFNSRVALNRYNASSLTAITSTISQKFSAFKSDYQSYTDSLSRTISYNCEADPRGFYAQLVTARTGREKVSTDISDLNAALDKYTDAYNVLRTSLGEQ